MLSKVTSAALAGIDAVPLEIEVDVALGIPNFQIVGLPDAAVRESRERVRAALRNAGRDLPPRSIVVNLAPADIRKEGSALDLPIALGLLASMGEIPIETLRGKLIAGELSLDGGIRRITGALSMSVLAARQQIEELVVPAENAEEGAAAKEIRVIGVRSLPEAVAHLRRERVITPTNPPRWEDDSTSESEVDFAEIVGQASAKRALEIAAAGGHNLLMIGPPGSGKTMLARRLPTVLPPLEWDEAIEATRIHSVAGLLSEGTGLIRARPFRSPHHSISGAGLVGGGSVVRPGEISLAHLGVLFLDELPEFRRDILELLRQPLEEGEVALSRAAHRVRFPARFSLVAAMNPCPCGYQGHPTRECRCTPHEVARYVSRLSGPLLDRIDLHVEVPPVPHRQLSGANSAAEPSRSIRERVAAARGRQERRSGSVNARISVKELRKSATPDPAAARLLDAATERLGLSARAHSRILRVARTIADLEGADSVGIPHVSEAIQYRRLDRSVPVGA